MPGLPVHHQLPEFTQTHVHRVGDAIQPSYPLSSPPPPAPNPSQHQSLFQWVNSTWGGQSTGVSALASFPPKKSQGWSPLGRSGWTSLQSKGLKSLLQHHSSKAPILRPSAFFTVQLSHPHMTTGKSIALTRRTFVDQVMSLLLNMLSRLVITFLPRSKRLLIPGLQSPSASVHCKFFHPEKPLSNNLSQVASWLDQRPSSSVQAPLGSQHFSSCSGLYQHWPAAFPETSSGSCIFKTWDISR